jgi:hypothetical protein
LTQRSREYKIYSIGFVCLNQYISQQDCCKGVFMNKYRFFTVLLVTAMAFGLAFTSCSDGSGSSPKTITITGITDPPFPGVAEHPSTVEFNIFTFLDTFEWVAGAWDDINSTNKFAFNDTIIFPLFGENGPWTGSGSFLLRIQFNYDNGGWVAWWYTNGKELGLPDGWSPADLGAALPKYKITSANTTIPFSKF